MEEEEEEEGEAVEEEIRWHKAASTLIGTREMAKFYEDRLWITRIDTWE